MQFAASLDRMENISTVQSWTTEAMERRIVRYADLRPCYNAFIDTRSPGSEAKENFTIIGPGVSENPEQHVHIAEPHGFNIGGARQPPDCINSQHSHDTAEVFVVHTGTWRFNVGEHGDAAQLICHPGDVISLPTAMFRGFTNVGEDIGFLWAVLGGDDPGRVLWAPEVFDMAKDYGLVLLESGQLIDTIAGQSIPADASPMPRTTPDQVAALHVPNEAQAEELVWRADTSGGNTAIIATGAPLGWQHPFTLDQLTQPNDRAKPDTPEVVFVHNGAAQMSWDGGAVTLGPGDTITIPVGLERTLSVDGVIYRVRGLV